MRNALHMPSRHRAIGNQTFAHLFAGRTLLLAGLFLLSFSTGNAQCSNNLVSNGNFSNGLTQWQTFSGYLPNPILNTVGCLDNFMVLRAWQDTTMSPSLYGDGMYQSFPIDSGKCYNLCLCMAATLGMPGNNVQFWAATNDPSVTYDNLFNNTFTPGAAALIGVIQVNSFTSQQYCINNWYAQNNFTRLIIFNSTTSQIQSSVLLDNICFYENQACTPCDYANISTNFSAQGNGLTVQFTDLSTIAIGTVTGWEWNFGDFANAPNDTSTQQNPVYTFSTAGIYIVCLKVYADVNGHPCVDSICFCVPVSGNPTNTGCDTTGMNNGFSYSLSGDTAIFTGFSNTAISYFWDFGDPAAGPSNNSALQNPVHIFSGPGTYNVCMEIAFPGTAGALCRDTICQTITIQSTGIREYEEYRIQVFPNPANDILHLKDVGHETTFEVYTLTGRYMMSGRGNSVNVAHLPGGVYILRSGSRYSRFVKM
jgi:PKD repeat protein